LCFSKRIKNENICLWHQASTIVLSRRCRSVMTRRIPTTLTKETERWECGRICRESVVECAGEPISIDTQDSYGPSGGSARCDAATGAGCTPCVGASLLTSCKWHSVLSWYTSGAIGIDAMAILYTIHICILRVWAPFCTMTTYFLKSKGWNIKHFDLRLYLYMLQWVNECVFFVYLCDKFQYKI